MLKNHEGVVVGRMPDGAIYFEQCYWPYLEEDDLDRLPEALEETMWVAVKSPPGPLVGGPDGDATCWPKGRAGCARSTDRAIIGLFGGNLLEIGQFLYRIDNFLMLLAGNPRRAHEFLDRLVELHLAEPGAATWAPWATTSTSSCSATTWACRTARRCRRPCTDEFFKPRHAGMWQRAKELADVKVMLHCCGGVQPLLRHLIEAGLDAINPVQISCAGMDPRGLKRDFGDDLTFWGGGCDTHRILSEGTAGRDPRARPAADRDLQAGRRFRVSAGAQHPGQRAAENVVAMFAGRLMSSASYRVVAPSGAERTRPAAVVDVIHRNGVPASSVRSSLDHHFWNSSWSMIFL